MSAAPAPGPGAGPVDALAAALQEDPVQVSPLFGNGRTDDVDAALTAVVDGVDFPAYVVLVPGPDGLSATDPGRDLAGRLHDRIGGDGVYVVQTDPKGYGLTVVSFGDVPDDTLVTSTSYELAPQGGADEGLEPAGQAARALDILDAGGDMTAEQFSSYAEQAVYAEPAEWDLDYDPPTAGSYAVGTTFAFVAVAGCAYLLLRTITRWRATAPGARPAPSTGRGRTRPVRPGEEPLPGPAEVRALAEAELDELAEALAERTGRASPRSRVMTPERQHVVDGSYDAARTLLRRTGTGPADLDDLVGALVLVRVAARAASGDRAYRPCFFDPRHGEGRHRRTVPVGDRELTVPACERCRHTTGRGLAPMHVRRGGPLGRLRREQPWYELDTVWSRTGYGAFVDELWQHVAADLRERR